MNLTPLQRFQAMKTGVMPPKRASDAEFIDDDIYASDFDPMMESEPKGLIDRLYRERFEAQPIRGQGLAQAVPTTKNRYA